MLLIMHTKLSNLPQIPNPAFITEVEQLRKFKSNIFHKLFRNRKTIPSKLYFRPGHRLDVLHGDDWFLCPPSVALRSSACREPCPVFWYHINFGGLGVAC